MVRGGEDEFLPEGRVPRLVVVADVDAAGGEAPWTELLRRIAQIPAGLPVAVQVRAKGRSVHALRELAARAREVLAGRLPVVLNGPAAVAQELRLAGVHWPEVEIPRFVPPEARKLLRSASVHGEAAAGRAERVAHYLVFGPVFPPGSKEASAVGLEALRRVCALSRRPVLAVGGITAERVGACLAAGAAGVAVVSAVVHAPDPAWAVARLVDALEGR